MFLYVFVNPNNLVTSQGMVILALLASVELFQEVSIPKQLPSPVLVLWVPSNGLCFWSCLYLHLVATKREQFFWFHRARTPQGFPLESQHVKQETETVRSWALQIGNGDMPESIKNRIIVGESVMIDDIDPRSFEKHLKQCGKYKRFLQTIFLGRYLDTIPF